MDYESAANQIYDELLKFQLKYKSECPELGVLLSSLQAMSILYKTFHWHSSGDDYYGDHLLYERLYTETSGEVDGLAEKMLGLSGINYLVALNPVLQIQTQHFFVKGIAEWTKRGGDEVRDLPAYHAAAGLLSEKAFLCFVDCVMRALEENARLTSGLSNMLEGISDLHEGHVYLLQQRIGKIVAEKSENLPEEEE